MSDQSERVTLGARAKLRMCIVATVVFVVTLLPFLQTATHAFINLDDYMYVVESLPVRCGLGWGSVQWALCSFSHEAIWMPLTWISYMADISLWGVSPGAMHVHSAVLHAMNAALLFVLFSMLLARVCGPSGLQAAASSHIVAAALATLIWSLHPLRVEPVAWIASRKDVLFLFWELWALIFWVKGVENGEASRRDAAALGDNPDTGAATFDLQPSAHSLKPAIFRYISLFCFGCACMSKPTAMTFPVLAGLLDVLVIRKVRWQALAVPTAMALACGLIAAYSQSAGGAKIELASLSFYGRILNACAAFGTYCWKTLFPVDLAMPYLHTWPALPKFFWQGLAICSVYGAALVYVAQKAGICEALGFRFELGGKAFPRQMSASRPAPWASVLFVGLAWFLVAVVPVLGLSNFGFQSHADRFTYLSSIGFSLVLAYGLLAHVQAVRSRLFRRGLVGCVAGGVAVCLVLTWRQTRFWKDDGTLFAHTLQADAADNHIACRNLGIYCYGTKHDCPEAVTWLAKAFRLNREGSRNAQLTYIMALSESGKLEEAREETRELSAWVERTGLQSLKQANRMILDAMEDGMVKTTSVRTVDTFLAYALVAHAEGDRALARQHAEYVLKSKPKNGVGHYIMGVLALEEGRKAEALEHWRAAVAFGNITQFTFLKARVAELERQVSK